MSEFPKIPKCSNKLKFPKIPRGSNKIMFPYILKFQKILKFKNNQSFIRY